MKTEAREYVMEILTAMVIESRASREMRTQEEVFKEFRRSKTFENLYNPELELWMNGPDYISDEYDIEINKRVG